MAEKKEKAPPTRKSFKEDGARTVMVEDDGGGKITRVAYIKREFAKGRKRGEIAKELGVPFQIVYAATKPAKPKEEKAATPA